MIGIELQQPVPQLVEKGLDKGVIFNITAEKVIRLLPPLIFKLEHADELVEKLYQILSTC